MDAQIGPSVQRNTASVRPAARAPVQGSYSPLKVSTLPRSYLRFMQSTTVRADSPSAVAQAPGIRHQQNKIFRHARGKVWKAWDDRTTLTGSTRRPALEPGLPPRAPALSGGCSTAAGIIQLRWKHHLSKEHFDSAMCASNKLGPRSAIGGFECGFWWIDLKISTGISGHNATDWSKHPALHALRYKCALHYSDKPPRILCTIQRCEKV